MIRTRTQVCGYSQVSIFILIHHHHHIVIQKKKRILSQPKFLIHYHIKLIYMYAFFSLTIKGQAKTKDMLRSRPLLPT